MKALLKQLHGTTKLNGDGSNWQHAFRVEELEATTNKFFQVRSDNMYVFTHPHSLIVEQEPVTSVVTKTAVDLPTFTVQTKLKV